MPSHRLSNTNRDALTWHFFRGTHQLFHPRDRRKRDRGWVNCLLSRFGSYGVRQACSISIRQFLETLSLDSFSLSESNMHAMFGLSTLTVAWWPKHAQSFRSCDSFLMSFCSSTIQWHGTRGVMIPFFTGIGIGITTKGVGIGIAWNRLLVGIDSSSGIDSTAEIDSTIGINSTT